MTATDLPSLPEDIVAFDAKDGAVSLRVDASLYPLEAIYAAAYVFIDRCFVILDRPSDGQTRVTLSPKKGEIAADTARDLVGEFANELLSCAWRSQIARDNRATIEAVTAQALSGARGAPSLEELEAFDFSDDAFEDPLGIAMSWEEKYAKKKAGEPVAGAAPQPPSNPEAAK
ncbi:MAG: His-Xaa-Ser system protein HxsD [Polyangiales bacterium]